MVADPDMKCPCCGATGFMELTQIEPEEYAWICECGGYIQEEHPEHYIPWKKKKAKGVVKHDSESL